ncbi:hypothetical protein CCL17_17715 [Pseudomonas congelans]|nr:hypothetical protein CCL17_17715 [Pseudomonas congelans]
MQRFQSGATTLERAASYTILSLILAEGRGSELVRERACTIAENASSEIPSSRTSEASPGSLPRPAGRITSVRTYV